MARSNRKKTLLVIPSMIVARGIESILAEAGEFRVSGMISDLSPANVNRLKGTDADIIVVDPSVFDAGSRANARSVLAEYADVPVAAIESAVMDEDSLCQYDAVINMFDSPSAIIKKLRGAAVSVQDESKDEGSELSTREKEILVGVATGMLNKEIADKYNISVYTVITHRKNIVKKTGIKTVAGLTVYALLNNLIDINSIE